MAFKRSGVRFPSPPLGRQSKQMFFAVIGVHVARRAELIGDVAATSESCGNSSVGRAQPCQGWGRGFESRFPLCRGRGRDIGVTIISRKGAAELVAVRDEGG